MVSAINSLADNAGVTEFRLSLADSRLFARLRREPKRERTVLIAILPGPGRKP